MPGHSYIGIDRLPVTVESVGRMNLSNPLALGMGDKEVNGDFKTNSFVSAMPYDEWISIHPSGWHPSARYKHAAEVVHGKLYVAGGSRNGRYLSDIQVFDLRTLKWSMLRANTDSNNSKQEDIVSEGVLPASAGHSLVKWQNKLLVVAGHSKESSDTVTVRSIDLETHNCHVVKTSGKVPTARGGQSVTLVGSRLIMFGGEDSSRRLLNDIHILDLENMIWDVVEAKKTSPSPRFEHTATVHSDRYLLIFGGSSHSTCFNDLHVLDLQTMNWSQPETRGASVTPRGGHAGTTVDDNWYIVGGGDNKSGATETIIFNMPKLVWSVATKVSERDPLASEGLSLCSTNMDGVKVLIAFGGYNGKYNNEVFLFKPKPRDLTGPRLLQSPAAAAAAASVSAAYALTTATNKKIINFTNTEDANLMSVQAESSPKVVAVDTDAFSAEKKILGSRLAEVRAENSRLKNSLDETNNSCTELSMELQSLQGQLTAENSRCVKLEVQIAEIQKKLESLSSVEHELGVLRRQKSQIEQDVAVVQNQRSASGWLW